MANILPTEKQIAVISALAEGSSIRSIERMTGVHRDTVMRLGVKVGQRSAKILDQKMRDLPCNKLQLDEIWGFVGKKQRRVREIEESKKIGDAWTFCALDAETKIVPCFKVGKRDATTANAFLLDLSGRLRNRVQISTDGLRAYIEAIEQGFGADVDYAQIVKSYESDGGGEPERKYSPPRVVSSEKRLIVGNPDASHVSTSYIERQNLTMRTHMRRLTRLTLGFSKKWENFEAAVALHFAYYNFCKIHGTTPVKETFQGKTVWEGAVEIFDLTGHPKATQCYAWAHASGKDDKATRYVAVLAIPPVKSPVDAVRASIVAEAQKQK